MQYVVLALAVIGAVSLACAVFVLAAMYLGTRHDWPDEDPTLDVQNHIGDARPTYDDRRTAYRRWANWNR